MYTKVFDVYKRVSVARVSLLYIGFVTILWGHQNKCDTIQILYLCAMMRD